MNNLYKPISLLTFVRVSIWSTKDRRPTCEDVDGDGFRRDWDEQDTSAEGNVEFLDIMLTGPAFSVGTSKISSLLVLFEFDITV